MQEKVLDLKTITKKTTPYQHVYFCIEQAFKIDDGITIIQWAVFPEQYFADCVGNL